MIVFICFSSCNNEGSYTPKPRIFPKVEYPDKQYTVFRNADCPFTFEIPVYSEIIKDKKFFGEEPPHPCWFDIEVDQFNASVYFSYIPLDGARSFSDLVEDSYQIASQINLRSDFMQETPISVPQNELGGLVFEFQGAAASPMHFYLTDSTDHFLKGALYFKTETRPDSLAPIIMFLKEDVIRMIESFEWN
jgi:gliding motility-associated lipoprotein GldD